MHCPAFPLVQNDESKGHGTWSAEYIGIVCTRQHQSVTWATVDLIICGILCHSPMDDLREMVKISATEVNQQFYMVDVAIAEDNRRQPTLPTQTSRAWH